MRLISHRFGASNIHTFAELKHEIAKVQHLSGLSVCLQLKDAALPDPLMYINEIKCNTNKLFSNF